MRNSRRNTVNCVTEEQLWLYYDGRMDAIEEAKVRAHLAQCRDCARVLEHIEKTGTMISSLHFSASSRDGEQDFYRIKDAFGTYSRVRAVKRLVAVGALAAGIILSISFLPALFNTVKEHRPLPEPGETVTVAEQNINERQRKHPSSEHAKPQLSPESLQYRCEYAEVTELTDPEAFEVEQQDGNRFACTLSRGSARFKVVPGSVDEFRVQTPDAVVVVCGTVFTVQVTGDGFSSEMPLAHFTSVTVESGKVEVQWERDGKSDRRFVLPGEAFSTAPQGRRPGSSPVQPGGTQTPDAPSIPKTGIDLPEE